MIAHETDYRWGCACSPGNAGPTLLFDNTLMNAWSSEASQRPPKETLKNHSRARRWLLAALNLSLVAGCVAGSQRAAAQPQTRAHAAALSALRLGGAIPGGGDPAGALPARTGSKRHVMIAIAFSTTTSKDRNVLSTSGNGRFLFAWDLTGAQFVCDAHREPHGVAHRACPAAGDSTDRGRQTQAMPSGAGLQGYFTL